MKAFVQTRVQAINNNKYSGVDGHNIRSIPTHNVINNNDNYLIIDDEIFTGSEVSNKIKTLNEIFQKNKLEHNKLVKDRTKRNLQKGRANTHGEGVITFSSEQLNEVKNNLGKDFELELLEYGKKAVKELTKEMGTESVYVALHMDETTPHFHFVYKNYDKEGRAITDAFKKKRYTSPVNNKQVSGFSIAQDMIGKSFSGLGFKRGIKKELSGAAYKKTRVWKKEQAKEKEVTLKKSLGLLPQDLSLNAKEKTTLMPQITSIKNIENITQQTRDIKLNTELLEMKSIDNKQTLKHSMNAILLERLNKKKKGLERLKKQTIKLSWKLKDIKKKLTNYLKPNSQSLKLAKKRLNSKNKDKGMQM